MDRELGRRNLKWLPTERGMARILTRRPWRKSRIAKIRQRLEVYRDRTLEAVLEVIQGVEEVL